MMRKIVFAVATTLALAGCVSNLNPDVATPNQMAIAVNAYTTAGYAAKIYLASPSCVASPPAPLCQQVYTAFVSGRAAAKQVRTALKTNSAVPLTALQALQAAYAVIQSIPK